MVTEKMDAKRIGIYFINLEVRNDRLHTFLAQFASSDLLVIRVPAISGQEVSSEELYAAPEVVACWKSHQKAFKTLLESDNSFAIIFEDDALVDISLLRWLEEIDSRSFTGIDLLQIGYLRTNGFLHRVEFDPSPRRLLNLDRYVGERLSRFDLFFRNWIRCTRFFARYLLSVLVKVQTLSNEFNPPSLLNAHKYFLSERNIRRNLRLTRPLIYHSFEAGTHAYVISREFAKVMIEFNDPVFLPADLCFMGIARAKNFRVLRCSKSMSRQSKSASSIRYRTLA
jgi:GR25 family glycosyltransferase involved in LPS biosynthesis